MPDIIIKLFKVSISLNQPFIPRKHFPINIVPMFDYCRTSCPVRKCITRIITTFILLLLFITGCGTANNTDSLNVPDEVSVLPDSVSFSRAVAVQDTAVTSRITPELKEWKYAGSLPKGLYDNAAAVWNGFLYVSGGFGPGPDVNTDDIFIYKIMPDGTLDLHGAGSIPNMPLSFKSGAKGVVRGIDGHAMTASNGHLYIVGGKFQYVRTDCYPVSSVPCFSPTPTAWNRSVLYTAINEDGTLSDWHEVPLPVNTGPYTPGVTMVNDHLYIIGGWDGERNSRTVVSAAILPDGSPGPWIEETPLPVGLSKHAVTVSGGFIYVVGGNTGMATLSAYEQGYSKAVYSAQLQGSHSIGEWRTAEPLPDTWIDHKVIAVSDGLFVIGGRNVNEYYHYTGDYYDYIIQNTVLYSRVGHDGTLSPWTPYNKLPVPVVRHAVAADAGLVYSIGGTSGQDIENIGCIQGVCSAPYVRESGIYLLDMSS